MLKLKRLDLLIKNDKIYKNGYCDHVQKYKKLECLCWEERESWDGWLAAVWEGRGGMGKKKGKKKEK